MHFSFKIILDPENGLNKNHYFYIMKTRLSLLIIIYIFIGCSKKVDLAKIDTINGYWQINKVEDENGNKKEYPINEVYDFYKLKNTTGIHKKVTWQLDNTFLVNDLEDKVSIFEKKEKIYISFTSKYGNHIEELKSLSEEEMILISTEKIKYFYNKVVLNKDK